MEVDETAKKLDFNEPINNEDKDPPNGNQSTRTTAPLPPSAQKSEETGSRTEADAERAETVDSEWLDLTHARRESTYDMHPPSLVKKMQWYCEPVIENILKNHGHSPEKVSLKITDRCMGGLTTVNVRSMVAKLQKKVIPLTPDMKAAFTVGEAESTRWCPDLKVQIASANAAAKRAGIFVGGIVVGVNGENVLGRPINEVSTLIPTNGCPSNIELLRLPICFQKLSIGHRHHCRSCKLVFCDSCCTKKIKLPPGFKQKPLLFSKGVLVCDFCHSLAEQNKLPKTAIEMIQYRNDWLKGITEGYAEDYFCLGLREENHPTVAEVVEAYEASARKFYRENNSEKVEEVERAFQRLTDEVEVDGQKEQGPHRHAYMHYVLGLKDGFTEKERIKAYRKAALNFHPDKQANKVTPSDAINPSENRQEYAQKIFNKIEKANKFLSNSEVEEKPVDPVQEAYKAHDKFVRNWKDSTLGKEGVSCGLCGANFIIILGKTLGTRHGCRICGIDVCNNCCSRTEAIERLNSNALQWACTKCQYMKDTYGPRPVMNGLMLLRANAEPPKGCAYLMQLDSEPAVKVTEGEADGLYDITIHWDLMSEVNTRT